MATLLSDSPALPQAAFGLGRGLRAHSPRVFFPCPPCLLRQFSRLHFCELPLSGKDPRLWGLTRWCKPWLCPKIAGQPSINCSSSRCLSFVTWLLHHLLCVDGYRAAAGPPRTQLHGDPVRAAEWAAPKATICSQTLAQTGSCIHSAPGAHCCTPAPYGPDCGYWKNCPEPRTTPPSGRFQRG